MSASSWPADVAHPVDCVFVPDDPTYSGFWVEPTAFSGHPMKTRLEMANGRAALAWFREFTAGITHPHYKIRIATEDEWTFVLALVVCGHGKRLRL